MPRRAIGERPMTPAERQARRKAALSDRISALEAALAEIYIAASRGVIGPKWAAQKAADGLGEGAMSRLIPSTTPFGPQGGS